MVMISLLDILLKKNQWKDGNILVFQFNIFPNNQNYFPQQEVNTATTYILGRKIKKILSEQNYIST